MSEPRAFFAIDQGAATTSAALVGHASGHWRLLGALALPAGIPLEAILDRLLHRSHVLNIKGRSYRLRDLEDALKLAHA